MINIIHNEACCGCTACFSVCPKSCITMESDKEGFSYPKVDKEKCISCSACEKVCPVVNNVKVYTTNRAYAVQNKDPEILFHSASGGAFTALSAKIIHGGGVVFGAAYMEDMSVHHVSVENLEDIYIFRSSKYVQSSMDDNFHKVKIYLNEGKSVLFSGTPCQIAGLKAYLRREYENLFTVDVVCKGVASPEVLRQYVQLMQKKFGSKIVNMNFKRKTYGYHSSTMSVDFENGKTYSAGRITDLMMRSFTAGICFRPSCEACAFKGVERCSDLTLFDCWHYNSLTGKKDDDRGYTAILVNTEKGYNILMDCNEYLNIDNINLQKAIDLDGRMVWQRTVKHEKRNAFFESLQKNGLSSAVNRHLHISLIERLAERLKPLLHRLGILERVKEKLKKR